MALDMRGEVRGRYAQLHRGRLPHASCSALTHLYPTASTCQAENRDKTMTCERFFTPSPQRGEGSGEGPTDDLTTPHPSPLPEGVGEWLRAPSHSKTPPGLQRSRRMERARCLRRSGRYPLYVLRCRY